MMGAKGGIVLKIYVCEDCERSFNEDMGKCPECGEKLKKKET